MLYDETRYFWAICQAVRSSSQSVDRKAAQEAVEDLEMIGLNTSSLRLLEGTLAGLRAATLASNSAARMAATLALRNLYAASKAIAPLPILAADKKDGPVVGDERPPKAAHTESVEA